MGELFDVALKGLFQQGPLVLAFTVAVVVLWREYRKSNEARFSDLKEERDAYKDAFHGGESGDGEQ